MFVDSFFLHIKAVYNKNKLISILFLLVSLCFIKTHLFCVTLIGLISIYNLIRVKQQKIDVDYLCESYFYLLVYSLIFTGYIVKIILFFLLLYLWIYSKNKNITKFNLRTEKIILLFFGLILLNHLIFKPYLYGLDVYIHYLLIPLAFLKLKKNIKLNIYKLLKIYITSVIVASLFLFIINVLQGTLVFKIHTFFSEPIGISHVYYGMFIGVAISFLLILDLVKEIYFNKFLSIIITIIFVSILFYIGARISIIGVFVIFGIYIYKKVRIKVYLKLSLIIIGVIISTITLKTPRVQKGVNSIIKVYMSVMNNNKQDLVNNSWRNMYQRFLVTSYSFEEIKEHPFLGIGLQNVTNKVSKKIINDGYKYFKPINSHNQYLQFLVGMGFLGLLYFLWIQFYLIKNTSNIFILFTVFFTIILLTESLIVREKGIIVFLLFSLLFVNSNND